MFSPVNTTRCLLGQLPKQERPNTYRCTRVLYHLNPGFMLFLEDLIVAQRSENTWEIGTGLY